MKIIIDTELLIQFAKTNKNIDLLCLASCLNNPHNDFNFIVKETKESNNDYKIIIDYLNYKTGKKFKHNTQKTKSLINARLREGFVIDDFKLAIDNQCNEWSGNMVKYLRPETLFGTKMEGYVNAIAEHASMAEDEMMKSLMEEK